MQFKKWLNESFDTVSDFMLNPEHRNKTFSELMGEFQKSGGEAIGHGKYGAVYSHPSWPYVLKTYADDSHYTKFVRFAYQNPHPAFPKFYGKPQSVLPFYRRGRENVRLYLVRLEKLEPISQELGSWLARNMFRGISYVGALKYGTPLTEPSYNFTTRAQRREAERSGAQTPEYVDKPIYKDITDMIDKYPKLQKIFEAGLILQENRLFKGSSPDYHAGNFMMRSNGDIVIIDPFWEGSSPYADELAQRELYYDDFGDDEPPEPDVVGGRLPKKKRTKRPRRYVRNDDEDVPF